ncbi:hypothetical protein KAJ27_05830, partial [bacterium]|nr:hypothetical protein [bacterium]
MKVGLVFLLLVMMSFSILYAQIDLVEPKDNAVIKNTNPNFQWKRVRGVPIYKLNIYEASNKNLVYWSVVRRKKTEIPQGFLFPGKKYLWEIEGYKRVKRVLTLIDRSKVFTL